MPKSFLFLFLLLPTLANAQLATHWESRSPMPVKKTNMATASLELGDTTWIFTFMGLDSSKACGKATLSAHKYNTVSDKWYAIADVPDTEGRIAASATGLNGKVYLIGGYKVAQNCSEFTSPRVDIYDPATDSWSLGDSTPKPTDDHLQVVWRDSLIYCISGWSQTSNIRNVQIYDTYQNSWQQGNLIAGKGLFGLSGSIYNDTIVYIDGVEISGFSFVLVNKVWKGIIDPSNPTNVNWTALPAHPGQKVYRGGGFTYANRIIFTGGTDNAYNIDGIGYNNQPSVESGRTFGYNLGTGKWEDYSRNPDSVMDVREIVPVKGNEFYVVGGMSANQTVTDQVSVFVVDSILPGRLEDLPGLVLTSPNPFGMSMWVEVTVSPLAGIRILDLGGREVQQLKVGRGRFKQQVNLLGLAEGVYLLEVSLENGKRVTRRVVRER